MSRHFTVWLWEAPFGLLLVGFGLSLLGHAVIVKARDGAARKWFLLGTLALISVGAGLSIFGDAIKHRVLYELRDGAPAATR